MAQNDLNTSRIAIFQKLFVHSPEGMILLANPTADEVFGYERGELEGHSISDLVPREKQEKHEDQRSVCFQEPSKRMMGKGRELQGVRKDGTLFPIEISLNYLEDEGGEEMVLSAVIDITDRLQYQKITELSIMDVQERERDEDRRLSSLRYGSP